jgi:hypothetical protein
MEGLEAKLMPSIQTAPALMPFLSIHSRNTLIEPSTYIIIQSQNLGLAKTCPQVKYGDEITGSTSGEGRPTWSWQQTSSDFYKV